MTLKSHLGLPEHVRPKVDSLAASLLDAARAGNGQLYAIVDLAAAEHASAWLTLLKREGTARNLFVSQPEAAAESLAAWLIPLGSGAACNEVLLGFSVAQALLSEHGVRQLHIDMMRTADVGDDGPHVQAPDCAAGSR